MLTETFSIIIKLAATFIKNSPHTISCMRNEKFHFKSIKSPYYSVQYRMRVVWQIWHYLESFFPLCTSIFIALSWYSFNFFHWVLSVHNFGYAKYFLPSFSSVCDCISNAVDSIKHQRTVYFFVNIFFLFHRFFLFFIG